MSCFVNRGLDRLGSSPTTRVADLNRELTANLQRLAERTFALPVHPIDSVDPLKIKIGQVELFSQPVDNLG